MTGFATCLRSLIRRERRAHVRDTPTASTTRRCIRALDDGACLPERVQGAGVYGEACTQAAGPSVLNVALAPDGSMSEMELAEAELC